MNPLIIIEGSECSDKNSLFTIFAEELQFPDYFANNWDSFEEIINDLPLTEDFHILILEWNEVLTSSSEDKDVLRSILKKANTSCPYKFFKSKII